MGGCQSLHTNGRDEALALPTEASARIALRTQQIVANESGAADIADPLGGSYALEALTDELEERAIAYLTRIDEMGGMVEAIARGYPQREIEEAAYQYQREIEDKKRVIVGVNEFKVEGEATFDTMQVDPSLEERQVKKLRAFRASRSQDAVQRSLSDLKGGAEGNGNVVPLIVAAVKSKATLGEIANSLREVFGEHGREKAAAHS
jgi:methylmalonyl-CoA mutase, N-terminal domain